MGCLSSKSGVNVRATEFNHKILRYQKTTKSLEKNESIVDLYKLEQIIAILPYGNIVKAIHLPTSLLRSIKILNLKINESIYLNENHLRLEVDTLSKLDHPNILKIYDILHDDMKLYIIMEYWEGWLLFDKIKQEGILTEKLTGFIIEQVLSAVKYCHDNKVIHRDLNPKLIFMMNHLDKPIIKIGEFGSSSFIDPEHILEGKFDNSVFVAPEVPLGNYNEKCDIWSVGMIMYALITGRTPFTENLNDICEEIQKKGQINVKILEELGVSQLAIDLILKMLRYDYNQRISATEALSHNWFKLIKSNTEQINKNFEESLNHLSCYSSTSKLIDAIQEFIARQIISHKESKNLIEVFKILDSNWDGKLSKQELIKYYKRSIPEDDAQRLVDDIFRVADSDHSGFIEYSEFIKSSMARNILISKQHLEAAFKMIDCDNNGKICRKELQSILDGTSLSGDKKWMKLLSIADKNNDGEIDIKEFYDMLLEFQ
ncbi:hypothetical protein SteCoe_16526 [Stentor coeruleus]|uniref:Uncharacterized protein n=1 Tax=Stentor coeruleus TaxID=5963 RepID=A0A1R2C112_9CILI|nr:hypothetical protein SteCoe_16526 [Stentor coeruleus]